jgi:hypothetical protein
MRGTDLTSYDAMLKDDLAPAVQTTLNEENQIQSFMATEFADETWQGRKKRQPIKLGRNNSAGSIGARGALPNAGRGVWKEYEIGIRDLYMRVGFDRYVMEQTRNRKGAYDEVMAAEMEGAIEDLLFRRNVIGWYCGKGVLAVVNGAHAATTTLEVKNPGNVTGTINANRYLNGDATSGMFVAILDGTTPTTIKGTATITAVNADGTDVTLDTPITAADGDLVVIAQRVNQNSYDKEPEGLLAGIDDSTYVTTYHNLSRTTYPQLKANVITGVGALSLDAMQQAIDVTNIRRGKGVDLLAMEHAVRRAYLALLEADRRYTGADLMKPDGGTKAAKKPSGKALTFGDIPCMVDRDAPYGMIFGIRKDSWVRYVENEGQWADEGGGIIKWVPDFDEYTAFYYLLENYHCHRPADNFRMEGITVNQVVAHAI